MSALKTRVKEGQSSKVRKWRSEQTKGQVNTFIYSKRHEMTKLINCGCRLKTKS